MTALSLTVEEFAERWEAEPKIAEAWLQAFAFAGFAVHLEDGRYAATPRALRLSLVPNIEEGPK
jgi:diadenosine tetraphosphate (Ap4A) HIT family hydrolase